MANEHLNHRKEKSWAVQVGDKISEWTSRLFAHPYMQVGIIIFCTLWFVLGLQADLLTAALSILAITLTQMVLNTQYDREADAHRRDVAMHAKLDELIAVKKGARNEFVGVEEKEEDEIVQLKDEVKQAILKTHDDNEAVDHLQVEQAVERATKELRRGAGSRSGKAPSKG